MGLKLLVTLLVAAFASANFLRAPTNLKVLGYQDGGIKLVWEFTIPTVTGRYDFELRAKQYNEDQGARHSGWTSHFPSQSNFLYSPTLSGYAYRFQVRVRTLDLAGRVTGRSDWSNTVTVSVDEIQEHLRFSAQASVQNYQTHNTVVVETPSRRVRSVPVPSQVSITRLDPRTVEIAWKVNYQQSDDYFFVKVTPSEELQNQGEEIRNFRVDQKKAMVRNLTPGGVYYVTVKTRRRGQDSSESAEHIVRMTREEDHVHFSNLRVTFANSSPGKVNVTWSVPEQSKRHISGYTVRFTTDQTERVNRWRSRYVSGSRPEAQLVGLQGDTEYFVKIEPHLRSGQAAVPSNVFTFRTPRPNPIQDATIFYNSGQGEAIRLDWSLTRAVNPQDISAYDVLLTQNPNLPEDAWQRIRINNRRTSVVLDDYISERGHYWVKINLRMRDGTTWKSGTQWRLENLGTRTGQVNVGNTVNYRFQSPGRFRIRWYYPQNFRMDDIKNVRIFYTDDKNLPLEEWVLKEIRGHPDQTSLSNLSPNRRYYVRILPIKQDGTYLDRSYGQITYTIRTNNDYTEYRPAERDENDNQQTSQRQENDESFSSQLCLKQCRVGNNECGSGERCYSTSRTSRSGWCISDSLARAIRQG